MKVVVLASGTGTRLSEVTDLRPKPLAGDLIVDLREGRMVPSGGQRNTRDVKRKTSHFPLRSSLEA